MFRPLYAAETNWSDAKPPICDSQCRKRPLIPCVHTIKGILMNTQELAEKIAENQNISKADARKIVDSVIAAISDAAAAGEEVNINGFGKFSVKSTPARTGRNPRTGAAMEIAAGRKVRSEEHTSELQSLMR